MKKLWLICAIVLLVGVARAQDITGTWQGTLQAPGQSLRTVLKISKGPDGALKTVFYTIDQTGQPFPVTKSSLEAGTYKFSIVGFGLSYEGKLSADGKTISGTDSQGSNTLPLVFTKVTEAEAWTIPEPPKNIPPMAATANPGFDVVTIKPSKPDSEGKGFIIRSGVVATTNTSVVDLLTFAYGLQQKQIVGGPMWTISDKFDVGGKPDIEGTPNSEQMRGMFKKLLADRYQLKFHYEQKELSVYALTVAKGGDKMTKNTSDPAGLPGLFFQGLGLLTVRNATMKDFSQLMQSAVLDRPVADQTGLKDRFDFGLKWTPDDSQFGGMGMKVPPPTDAANAPPSLFTALPEQLGLRMDATKAPVQVLVIDCIQKPTAN